MHNNTLYYLKQATKEDKGKLIEFNLNTILKYAGLITQKEKAEIISFVTNDVDKNLDKYKIIYIDNNIVGCFAIKDKNQGVLLDIIYLEQNYRNKGLGSEILKYILDKNKIVYLWVYKSNKRAISLYLKVGFRIVDETETRFYMKHEIERKA